MGQNTCQVNEVQYLLVVLNNLEGGTINHKKMAETCGMPSAAASYMKYNRLKKANPVPGGGAIPAESDNTAGRGAKGANSGRNAMSATPSKKRKVNSVAHEDGDDEEPQTPVKKKKQAAKLKVEDDEED